MRFELVDLTLRSHSLSMDREFFPALVEDWDQYTVETMAGITSWKLIPKIEEPSLARFVQTVGFRWVSSHDGEEKAVATIEAQYGLLFSTEPGLDRLELADWLRQQVVAAVWPYWRQDFSQMALKASLPIAALPPSPSIAS